MHAVIVAIVYHICALSQTNAGRTIPTELAHELGTVYNDGVQASCSARGNLEGNGAPLLVCAAARIDA